MLQCVTQFYQSIFGYFAKYIYHFHENYLLINGSVKPLDCNYTVSQKNVTLFTFAKTWLNIIQFQ